MRYLFTFFFLLLLSAASSQTIAVTVDEPKGEIQPTMWGIFFEDINFAADGGVYAELVKNRSFEFAMPLMGWKEQKKEGGNGSVLVINRGNSNENNPRFVRAKVSSDQGSYGLSNEGFRGMGIKANHQYDFSILARQNKGSNIVLNVELVNAQGEKIGGATISPKGEEWKRYH